MRRSKQSGVTLLEIMLVLAIAAMIVVLSIRYYRSASNNQGAAQVVTYLQGVIGAADSLEAPAGTYSNLSAATIQSAMPTPILPWGAKLGTFTGYATYYTLVVTGSIPVDACNLISTALTGNPKVTITSACPTAGGTFTFKYDATQ